MQPTTGVLLVNLGTPTAASQVAVRHFLRAFLQDRRVVDLPRPLWWCLLNGIILPLRAGRVARAYQSIWTPEGSPLLAFGLAQQQALGEALRQVDAPLPVALAMTYGEPSLARAWQTLKAQGVNRVVLLPLFPQYSSTSTAPVFDAWSRLMAREPAVPALDFIADYHAHPGYIAALAAGVRRHWQAHGQDDFLLLSFHGIPERYVRRGDPYEAQCHATARLLAAALALQPEQWGIAFQSRFGREVWLQPYTDQLLQQLPVRGIRRLGVLCPGFAADCLETLEEIAVEGKNSFLAAGGSEYHYLPALNAQAEHISLLRDLVLSQCRPASEWPLSR